MTNDDRIRIIHRRTPESAAMLANVKRAMAITAALNRLTFDDADEIRALFSELIGKKVDESFSLIPPFYTAGGDEIRIGRNVFVNQNCTFYDLGGLDIADDVLIGPNVSIITAGHPLEPSRRRNATVGKPIVIEKNVWIAAGATIIGGVTVGENSVVTRDVPPNTLAGGNPARAIRSIGDWGKTCPSASGPNLPPPDPPPSVIPTCPGASFFLTNANPCQPSPRPRNSPPSSSGSAGPWSRAAAGIGFRPR